MINLTTQYFEFMMGKMSVSLDDLIFGLIMLAGREDSLGGPYNNPPAAVYGGVN